MMTVKLADGLPKLISYVRVSSKKQGIDGLGLSAQVTTVQAYAASIGAVIVKEYREVESGKNSDRPELAKALAHAKRIGGRLVIARLDRLSRNVAFLANLMEAGVDFVACDQPSATPLTLHVLAAVAQDELARISARTKAALATFVAENRVPKRLQGTDGAEAFAGKLGSARPGHPTLTHDAIMKGVAKAAELKAKDTKAAYADLVPIVRDLQATGLSLRKVAARLDAEGYTTRTGKSWNPVQILRVLALA